MNPHRLDEALKLAALLRPTWAEMQRELRESGVPLNDGDPDPAPTPDPDPKPDPDPTPAPDPKPDPEPKPDPASVTLPKDEAERLRRLDREDKQRQRKAQEEAGKHAEIVQQVEKERDEKDAALAEKDAELATLRNGSAIRDVAGRLNFHDAEDAVLRTPSEIAEKGDAAIEKHLRDLAKKSPHLIGTGAPRNSASVDPAGGGEGDQLTSTEGMTPEQIVKAQSEGRLDDYMKSK
jgi:outer membrane biosynthesis protein TonB